MANCVIFCAAEFDKLLVPVEKDDYVIAADGGLSNARAAGISPDCILGDFDSLGYVPADSSVFPVEKDDTDAMLAVRRGLSLGFRRFLIYGGLDGPRLDHTVANFQTLQFLAEHGAWGCLIGNTYIATVVKNATLRFPAHAEGILSVFCMGQDAAGVTLQGLKYPMENGCLRAGFPLGVSNHFTGRESAVCVKDGCLLVLFHRKNGLPEFQGDLTYER